MINYVLITHDTHTHTHTHTYTHTHTQSLSLFLSLSLSHLSLFSPLSLSLAQSTGAAEYTDCTSAAGVSPPPNVCPKYDTKQSDGEVPVMLEL